MTSALKKQVWKQPFDERIRFLCIGLLSISTLNFRGMVSIVGTLYVHVPSDMTFPFLSTICSSIMKSPIPCTKAPSICRIRFHLNIRSVAHFTHHPNLLNAEKTSPI